MNLFDIIFIAIIIVFFFLSFLKGIMKDSLTTIGLLVGYFAAGKYQHVLIPYVSPYVQNPAASKVATYLLIVIGGWLAGLILSVLISLFFPGRGPSLSGRILGGVFGLVKGTLICLIIFFIIRGYVPAFADELEASMIAPWLQKIWITLHDFGLA